jgi:hypothetical protein
MIANTLLSCLICDSSTEYFFSKKYSGFIGSPFPDGFKVDFFKCINCGFTLSRTHKEMDHSDWVRLNESWHRHHEFDNKVNQPPYINIILALNILIKSGICSKSSILDYAAGYGAIQDLALRYFNIPIEIYDEYVQNPNKAYVDKKDLLTYKTLINTAMFEHIINRSSLDEVNSLVADNGVLVLHTFVSENVPKNPDWFYLNPHVHTAFHTYRSMEILMKQWGYSASVYAPEARCWFIFKQSFENIDSLEFRIEKINIELQRKFFFYKSGFVDYWK